MSCVVIFKTQQLHWISVMIKATSPQLLRSQDFFKQLLRLRGSAGKVLVTFI